MSEFEVFSNFSFAHFCYKNVPKKFTSSRKFEIVFELVDCCPDIADIDIFIARQHTAADARY